MDKAAQVKIGSTPCDHCHRPSTRVIGRSVVCDVHADLVTSEGNVKVASAQTETLRSAPITFQDKHR